MQMTKSKVPQFTMSPHPMIMASMILILITGTLLTLSFFAKEEGTGQYRQQGILTLIITVIVTIFFTILATFKFWFTHLWKKNSTHARHKQHTKFHPLVKAQEFRNKR